MNDHGGVRTVLLTVLATILLGGTLATALNAQSSTTQVKQAVVAMCEVNNPLRAGLYRNTLADAQTREAAVPGFTGQVARDVARKSERGYEDAEHLIEVASEAPRRPGSAELDCEEYVDSHLDAFLVDP